MRRRMRRRRRKSERRMIKKKKEEDRCENGKVINHNGPHANLNLLYSSFTFANAKKEQFFLQACS